MDETERVAHVFSSIYPSDPSASHVARIVQLLKSGKLSPVTFRETCKELRLEPTSLKEDLLDLVLQFIRACLSDHLLTNEEKSAIRWLKAVFKIREGDFYRLRQEEVQDLLVQEVRRILEDKTVDPAESLHHADLQWAFGLSYDRWLELTRGPIAEVVNSLLLEITVDGVVTENEREQVMRQLLALDTVYMLSPTQKRLLKHSLG